jgi:acyl carrier protein
MTKEEIGSRVEIFIGKTFLFDATKRVDENVSLLGTGVIDSTGVLELISFLEAGFNVKFDDSELVGDNFDSVAKIVNFIYQKIMSR